MAENLGKMCDETGDLLIRNGSFVIGNTEQQEMRRILLSAKGGYYWLPFLGVDIQMKLGMAQTPDERRKLVREIRQQLLDDGFLVNEVKVSADGMIDIDAFRN